MIGRGAGALAPIADRLAQADLVLLGELHDNPAHHRIRAELIVALEAQGRARGGRPIGIVAEHIRAEQALALAGFRALDRQRRRSTDELFAALDWSRSGWPAASAFAPLFESVLDLELPLHAGDAPRDVMRAVARGGLAALEADERRRVGLDAVVPADLREAMLAEVDAAHCGLIAKSKLPALAEAQVYRDAHLARALADAGETHGRALLLAGNGHVRADRGVPFHLQRAPHSTRVAVVLFGEVEPGKSSPLDYTGDGKAQSMAQILVLTPAVERPDPCAAMRKHLGR